MLHHEPATRAKGLGIISARNILHLRGDSDAVVCVPEVMRTHLHAN